MPALWFVAISWTIFYARFIISDLDETHLFIIPDVKDLLQEKLDDLMDSNSFAEPQWTLCLMYCTIYLAKHIIEDFTYCF